MQHYSGSGKTTFLEHTAQRHKCVYIKQYHNIRPFVRVSAIPNFDPTQLPYWHIYENEKKANTIKAGGTMAGEFTAGLSGGQRKLLLFELIYQRTVNQDNNLLVLDEPFAGVTDDFVPFIVERLNLMREHHNILLVTNDHVETLKSMADNTITVSAIDRSTVQVNHLTKVDREKAILALSVGSGYEYQATWDDLKFFFDVEILGSGSLIGVAAFTVFSFSLFLATFWGSDRNSGALVLVAANIVAFFCMNPYLLSLVDWRNYMSEEAEALLHSSKAMNRALKSLLTCSLIFIVSLIDWGIVNAVIDGFEDPKFWVGILFDSVSMTIPFIFLGLYTRMPATAVEIFAAFPFLFMIFFSTTFSPGSGVDGLKEFRYLFSRFYLWCMIPEYKDLMEGCPADNLLTTYAVLSGILGLVLFLVFQVGLYVYKSASSKKENSKRNQLKDEEFRDLQKELYGEDLLGKTNHTDSSQPEKTEQSDFPESQFVNDVEQITV